MKVFSSTKRFFFKPCIDLHKKSKVVKQSQAKDSYAKQKQANSFHEKYFSCSMRSKHQIEKHFLLVNKLSENIQNNCAANSG